MVPSPPPSTTPSMTQRRGASRSRTVQTTRPRRPATLYSSLTFSPGSSEWSVAPLTPREDGCHAGPVARRGHVLEETLWGFFDAYGRVYTGHVLLLSTSEVSS